MKLLFYSSLKKSITNYIGLYLSNRVRLQMTDPYRRCRRLQIFNNTDVCLVVLVVGVIAGIVYMSNTNSAPAAATLARAENHKKIFKRVAIFKSLWWRK